MPSCEIVFIYLGGNFRLDIKAFIIYYPFSQYPIILASSNFQNKRINKLDTLVQVTKVIKRLFHFEIIINNLSFVIQLIYDYFFIFTPLTYRKNLKYFSYL